MSVDPVEDIPFFDIAEIPDGTLLYGMNHDFPDRHDFLVPIIKMANQDSGEIHPLALQDVRFRIEGALEPQCIAASFDDYGKAFQASPEGMQEPGLVFERFGAAFDGEDRISRLQR